MQHDVKEAREAIAEVADNNAILAAVCLTEGATALDWSTTSHKPLHMCAPAVADCSACLVQRTVVSCCAVPRCAVVCDAVLCHAVLCFATLCCGVARKRRQCYELVHDVLYALQHASAESYVHVSLEHVANHVPYTHAIIRMDHMY